MRPALLLAALLGGCAAVVPEPMTADRAAGTITFVADRSLSPASDADWSAAQVEADRRCEAWGYTSADAMAVICNERLLGGRCNDARLIRQYQCVD